tara:strand:- start:1437 stop:2222 length:786 start_codon:yes stop_codon:yes gene_type:complete
MMNKLICGFLAAAILTLGAQAQFHSKTDTGHTAVNQHAIDSAQAHYDSLMNSQSGGAVGHNSLSTIYVSDANRDAYGASLGEQKDMSIHVWGRAIHHSDGTYTESKQDESTNTLEQITKSKNGTKLQRRMVNLDENGRPIEVMIYDGRDQFKYRGQQIYDELGRFQEEQLYDADDTLIRRKVQEYTAQGKRLPLRSWDYVTNVPKDLQLVITRESEAPTSAPAETGKELIGNAPTNSPTSATGAQKERKGPNFGRLFGRKK